MILAELRKKLDPFSGLTDQNHMFIGKNIFFSDFLKFDSSIILYIFNLKVLAFSFCYFVYTICFKMHNLLIFYHLFFVIIKTFL